ncbi:MAG: hypothetical protein RM049_31230 [Nostoc sp. DedQUE04]|nr:MULTISPECIES: hypothetical protein [unclassified Nostoc]MDZ8132496.1 hypothetical protein [Nostoc sp. DedQUE07]MDZ8139712.1 hypothetical protein [Nostoc sp. DedQUE04]
MASSNHKYLENKDGGKTTSLKKLDFYLKKQGFQAGKDEYLLIFS